MELCQRSVRDFQIDAVNLSLDTVKSIARDVVCGLKYLHAKKIIHRDIKPSNLLINETMQVKICDFGLSIVFDERKLNKDRCGTRNYLPPEVVSYDGWRLVSDMWAVGVTVYELLAGMTLFDRPKKMDIFDTIMAFKNDIR